MSGYLRTPALSRDHVAFICEDALWLANRENVTGLSNLRRLTSEQLQASSPVFSPCGEWIAYASHGEGAPQVRLAPVRGGRGGRGGLGVQGGRGGESVALTAEAEGAQPVAFRNGNQLVFRSKRGGRFRGESFLYELEVDLQTGCKLGSPRRLPLGRALLCEFASDGDQVLIGRNRLELGAWKRYRGGTAGDVWIGSLGAQDFRRLLELDAGPVQPMFYGERVFFLTDKDGVGNIWSCDLQGEDLRQHTFAKEHFVRWMDRHEHEFCFSRGAELWLWNAQTGRESQLECLDQANGVLLGVHRERRIARGAEELSEMDLAADGQSLCAIVRGKLLSMDAWGVGRRWLRRQDGVRYRLPRWMSKPLEVPASDESGAKAESGATASKSGSKGTAKFSFFDQGELVCLSDEGGEEQLEWLHPDGQVQVFPLPGLARVAEICPAPASASLKAASEAETETDPQARRICFSDYAGGLWLWDLASAHGDSGAITKPEQIAQSQRGPIQEISWSADGRWLAFMQPLGWTVSGGVMVLFDCETGTSTELNDRSLPTHCPSFDPSGRLLYVLSQRSFNPVLDEIQFRASVPQSTRVYAFVLQADQISPLDPRWPDVVASQNKQREREREAAQDAAKESGQLLAPAPVHVDIEGLSQRIVELPDIPVGVYSDLQATVSGVSFLEWDKTGLLDEDRVYGSDDETGGSLVHLELATGKRVDVVDDVSWFQVAGDKSFVRTQKSAWLVNTAEEMPEDPPRKGKNRGTGELDLGRLDVEFQPHLEWRQMFREAWRLQRDHFWSADMAGVDWAKVYEHYLPLLDKVATRAEMSDLIWEMQGELGTSHAYEMGGDYPAVAAVPVGLLGADFAWDAGAQAWVVSRVLQGDYWFGPAASPLSDPGVGVRAGDQLLAVDGQVLSEGCEPQAALVNRAGQHVELTVRRVVEGDDGATSDMSQGEERRVFARCLTSEQPLRYRDWVLSRRAKVLELSEGKLGYLHIPDMGGWGLSLFFRDFATESKRDGLIVDVRENGGGFVSEIIIDCLRRKVIGYDRPRNGTFISYPIDAVRGPMVAICNQFAGSDGDMVCQAFRDHALGPIVGRRTWGGTIGIDVNQHLVDGTVVTQPEYAFCFESNGWEVENYGVQPDFPVDLDPASEERGEDPQLAKAIELALQALAKNPVKDPNWPAVPSRKLPWS